MPIPALPYALGQGLLIRQATLDDTEALATFIGTHFGADSIPNAVWTRDLLSGRHPTFTPSDFILVEDQQRGAIVSALNLISQTWSYAGIPISVGRPELVVTHPDYRRRGLVRAQFEVLHGLSAARGEQLLAITGIPWFYRQFGYELALALGGGRAGAKPPALPPEATEPYRLRPATTADIPFIAGLDLQGGRRSLVHCLRSPELWDYEMNGRGPDNIMRRGFAVVETPGGVAVGFVMHATTLWGRSMGLRRYEVQPGISWMDVTPTVMRWLWETGERLMAQAGTGTLEGIVFLLGGEHPAYTVAGAQLPQVRPTSAFYMRVPDLPQFLRTIAPALEARLANSLLVGYTGHLRLSFYQEGVWLRFAGGQLQDVGTWRPEPGDEGNAAFPNLTFLQLLFGYRSLDDLKYAFADCWTDNDQTQLVLQTLFPQQHSDVWAVS